MRPRPMPINPALEEMLRASGELDRILDGRGLTFTPAVQVGPPPVPPQPLYIPPPDWDQEERERLAREKAARVAEAQALLEAEQPPEKPTPPAPKQRRPWWKDYAA